MPRPKPGRSLDGVWSFLDYRFRWHALAHVDAECLAGLGAHQISARAVHGSSRFRLQVLDAYGRKLCHEAALHIEHVVAARCIRIRSPEDERLYRISTIRILVRRFCNILFGLVLVNLVARVLRTRRTINKY